LTADTLVQQVGRSGRCRRQQDARTHGSIQTGWRDWPQGGRRVPVPVNFGTWWPRVGVPIYS